jgi:hypothetical protein
MRLPVNKLFVAIFKGVFQRENNVGERENMLERIGRASAVFTALAVILLMHSCAGIPRQAETEESLRNTASVYWKLKMEGKFDETLKMEEKENLIKANTGGAPLNEFYRAKAAMTPRPYEIKKVSIQDGKGRVDMEFTVTFPEIPRPIHQPFTDQWIFKDGKWLHLFR